MGLWSRSERPVLGAAARPSRSCAWFELGLDQISPVYGSQSTRIKIQSQLRIVLCKESMTTFKGLFCAQLDPNALKLGTGPKYVIKSLQSSEKSKIVPKCGCSDLWSASIDVGRSALIKRLCKRWKWIATYASSFIIFNTCLLIQNFQYMFNRSFRPKWECAFYSSWKKIISVLFNYLIRFTSLSFWVVSVGKTLWRKWSWNLTLKLCIHVFENQLSQLDRH